MSGLGCPVMGSASLPTGIFRGREFLLGFYGINFGDKKITCISGAGYEPLVTHLRVPGTFSVNTNSDGDSPSPFCSLTLEFVMYECSTGAKN